MSEKKQYWDGFLDDVESPQEAAQKRAAAADSAKSEKWAGFLDDVESPHQSANSNRTVAPSELLPKPEETRWSKLPAMYGQAAAGAAQSLIGIPGDLWQGANQLMPPAGPGEEKSSLEIPLRKKDGQTPFFSTTDEIAQASGLGLKQNPKLAPKTAVERYGVAGVEGAIGAAPALMTGGAALPILASGAFGGMASEGANQLAPGTILPAAAGILAGGLTQGGFSILSGNKVEKLASSFGQSRTVQEAGRALQDDARELVNTILPQKHAELAATLKARIPGDSPVKMSNYAGILDSINDRAGDLQASADVLTPAGARRLQKALQLRDEVNALAGKGPGEPTTWDNSRALRSLIGEAKSDPMLVKDIGKKNMDALYSGLTKDMGKTAELLGAKDLWENYNAQSTKLYNFAENKLSKVITSGDERLETLKPEDVAVKLMTGGKKGSTDLEALKEHLPNGVNELTAASLRHPTAWKNLSPEAKATMVPDAAMRKQLDKMMPQVVNSLSTTNNLLSLGVGNVAGGSLVPLALTALGSTVGHETAQQIGNAVGMTAPLLYQGGKAIVQNPRLLTLPAAGGLGANTVNELDPRNK